MWPMWVWEASFKVAWVTLLLVASLWDAATRT
jgi:hypothetical protein